MSSTRLVSPAPDLDRWLAAPAVRTHHEREAAVDARALWRAAATVRIGDSGLLGRLVRWRVPGTRAGQTYAEMFATPPFLALERDGTHLLSGLCGRIWTARPALATLRGAGSFRDWREPGTVRVLFAQWVTPTADGSRLVSEVRVEPVDRGASLRLRGLWPLIGRFEGLIGSEPLTLAVRRAESGRFERD